MTVSMSLCYFIYRKFRRMSLCHLTHEMIGVECVIECGFCTVCNECIRTCNLKYRYRQGGVYVRSLRFYYKVFPCVCVRKVFRGEDDSLPKSIPISSWNRREPCSLKLLAFEKTQELEKRFTKSGLDLHAHLRIDDSAQLDFRRSDAAYDEKSRCGWCRIYGFRGYKGCLWWRKNTP